MEKTKIGIDARFYGPKLKGLGRYNQKLLENLQEIETGSQRQYYIFLGKEDYESFQPKAANFKKVLADFKWYGFEEQLFFGRFLNKFNLDLMHFSHFNVPLTYRKKFVVTIHDLILFHYPTVRNTTLNKYFYFLKLLAYHWVIRSSAKRAEKIIAVSEFTQRDIVERLKINSEKIKVIYEACDMLCHYCVRGSSEILGEYKIKKPYLLYVGNAYPHKNLERLCRVFGKLRKKHENLNLVLVGDDNYFYQRIKKYVENEKITGIIFAGFVSDEKLDIIYKEAIAYVFPSLYEGFGLPPLEAMAKNLPVVSSDRSSMKEILQDGAVYFDPESEDEMKKKMEEVIESENLREDLKARGREIIAKYDWKEMAKKTRDLYLEAISSAGKNRKQGRFQ